MKHLVISATCNICGMKETQETCCWKVLKLCDELGNVFCLLSLFIEIVKVWSNFTLKDLLCRKKYYKPED
jgi:hypothetical protein